MTAHNAALVRLSATAAAQRLARKEISAEELTSACLARASTRNRVLHAWSHIDSDAALRTARLTDKAERGGPLRGIPIGVKDLFDVAGMPTTYGSPIYADHVPMADASMVALARKAGAIALGKTVSVEFAASHPTSTRNPHNPQHTPGASSSGSAAAVADFHTPIALGTQTGGSVIRPAAFCGIVGFKSSFGRLSLAGVKMCAWSLDTMGIMARHVSDCDLVFRALTGDTSHSQASASSLRIGIFRDPQDSQAEDCARVALGRAARILATSGISIAEVAAPDGFDRLRAAQRIISRFEMARCLAWEWNCRRALLSDDIVRDLEEGWDLPEDEYLAAKGFAKSMQHAFKALFTDVDFLLTLATPGEAPRGLRSTGSAIFNTPWTLLGLPAICLPFDKGPAGLPLAIQLIGRFNRDEDLLATGQRIETLLDQAA